MSDLTAEIDEYHKDKRAIAHMYLLTVAAKAIAILDAVAAAEDGTSSALAPGPLLGLYHSSGARVVKRSRKGKSRQISLHIMVDDKGTFLYWSSLLGLRKKKFNLSTLFEVSTTQDNKRKSSSGIGGDSGLNVIRLRNIDRTLDLVALNHGTNLAFISFFNGFRR